MAESEGEASVEAKKSCKYCKKTVTVGQNCRICDVTYHHSCAQRVKMCCNHSLQEKFTPENSNTHSSEETFLREENVLLRQIIKDKTSIIKDKETLITLLNNKINNLEEKLRLTEEKQKTQVNKSINTVQISVKNTDVKKADKIPIKQNNEQKQVNLEELRNKQTDIMEQIINLNNDTYVDCPQENEGTYQKVNHRKKIKKPRLQIGEAEISKEDEINGFVGRDKTEKKIWLFLSRVKDHVTEEIVKNYLENKTSSTNDIYVKEIDTFRKLKDNRCFKVGLNFILKEQAYTTSFWPKGVAVYRFNFKKEEKHLNRLRDKNTETENFPGVSQVPNHLTKSEEQETQAVVMKTHPQERNQNFLEASRPKKKHRV